MKLEALVLVRDKEIYGYFILETMRASSQVMIISISMEEHRVHLAVPAENTNNMCSTATSS